MSATCIFPHCCSSVCSSRSASCFPPLPQQRLLPQERIYLPTAAAVPAPAGAFPLFPHCRSSVRSRRSAIYISPLPQQCPFPQEPSHYFPTAAAVSAPAGAPSIPPHCRSSVRSHRSTIYISPLPQQYLPSHPPSSPHTATPAHFSRSRFCLQDAAASLQALSSIPSALKPCNFLGGSLSLFGCCPTISILWGAFGSGPNAELGPLSLGEGSTPGSGTTTELGALSSDSTPNTHTVYSVHY